MIPYEVKVSTRARAMRVSVYPDGVVTVTVPRLCTQSALERFIARYSAWIERTVAKTNERKILYAEKALIPLYKEQAHVLVRNRCAYFAKVYGVSYGALSIRAQKSRWGSCSKAGNLSFNYKIALLPREIADYIIVHEICHLIAFDHSKHFWMRVAEEVPEHKRIRKELRETVIRFIER